MSSVARPYLITFAEDKVHPGVRLRGTASKSRATLQINQPRELSCFAVFLSGLNGCVFTGNAARKESQGVPGGLAVIHRDIKEKLGYPKLA